MMIRNINHWSCWQPFSLKQCFWWRSGQFGVGLSSKTIYFLMGELLAVIMVNSAGLLSSIMGMIYHSDKTCLAPLNPSIVLLFLTIFSLCKTCDYYMTFSLFQRYGTAGPNIFWISCTGSFSFLRFVFKRVHSTNEYFPSTDALFSSFPILMLIIKLQQLKSRCNSIKGKQHQQIPNYQQFMSVITLSLIQTDYSSIKMTKKVLLVLLALVCTRALHLQLTHNDAAGLAPSSANILADNGEYLRVCQGCGGYQADSASIQANNDTNSLWTLEVEGDQVAFKGSNGLYLGVCTGCWSDPSIASAFVHLPNKDQNSLWTPQLQANGKYTFLGSNGKYLARCNRCTTNPSIDDFAFAKEDNPANDWAQWEVQYPDSPLWGTITFQADNGGFLRICDLCVAKDSVSIEEGSGPSFEWKVARVGDKVAFQGANGMWLSRCTNCWTMAIGAYGFSAFANRPDYSTPESQWTAVHLPNGKWAFKSDAGLYLARCHICARTAVDELAFLHVPGYEEYPNAQWTIAHVQ